MQAVVNIVLPVDAATTVITCGGVAFLIPKEIYALDNRPHVFGQMSV